MPEAERSEPQNKAWTFEQAANALPDQVSKDQHSVRVRGPSGFGKSRFAYETFNRRAVLADEADHAAVIYADYSIVGDEIPKLALEIAESGSGAILVVDECPDQIHYKLAGIAQRAGSCLRVVTIDVETRIEQSENTLTIRLEPAAKEMISAIAKAVDPKIPDSGHTTYPGAFPWLPADGRPRSQAESQRKADHPVRAAIYRQSALGIAAAQ